MEPLPTTKPTVITWFKVYAGVMAFIYLLVLAAGIFFLLFPRIAPEEFASGGSEDQIIVYVYGGMFIFFGSLFFVAYMMGLFLKPKRWVWIFNIVLICIGLTGCPTLFASIPLLIFWLKPEVKAYYGR